VRPHQRHPPANNPAIWFPARDPFDVVDAARLQCPQLLARLCALPLAMNRQCGGGSRPALQRLRGNRPTAVPVLIEGPGELTRDGTRYKDIVVGELRFRVHLEVLIADIASSDERYCVVGD